jgi:hypothetical protein
MKFSSIATGDSNGNCVGARGMSVQNDSQMKKDLILHLEATDAEIVQGSHNFRATTSSTLSVTVTAGTEIETQGSVRCPERVTVLLLIALQCVSLAVTPSIITVNRCVLH